MAIVGKKAEEFIQYIRENGFKTDKDVIFGGNVKFGGDNGSNLGGFYLSGVVAVTVPAITDPDIAKVDVDVDAAFSTITPAVGDAVIAIPQEALPTNARLQGAWITANNSVQVTFGSEGGNVSSSAKNFKFLVIRAS